MSIIDKKMGEKGMGRAATLFILAIAACIFYSAYQVLPFYYYYYEIQGQFDAQVKVGYDRSDREIREFLMEQIDKLELPIDDERDLVIRRVHEELTIELEYEEVFWISLGDKDYRIWTFPFHPKAVSKNNF